MSKFLKEQRDKLMWRLAELSHYLSMRYEGFKSKHIKPEEVVRAYRLLLPEINRLCEEIAQLNEEIRCREKKK